MIIQTYSKAPLIKTISHVFDKEFCDAVIQDTEKLKYEIAPITVDGEKGVFEMNTEVRNNERVIIDNDLLARTLFHILKNVLPTNFKGWELEKLNSRFRFYRYTPGQTFKPHIDGKYKESENCESKLTLLLYLSEPLSGGETTFFRNIGEKVRVILKPEIGKVVIFDHHQLHSGDPVVKGVKYVLRTDVMYVKQ